jgi:hypothetical protein
MPAQRGHYCFSPLGDMTMTNEEFQKLLDETAENLSRCVNAGCEDDLNYLATKMVDDHRTLVQGKMRLVMLFVEKLNDLYQQGYYDLRNEHACKVAEKICKATDKYDRYMPLI